MYGSSLPFFLCFFHHYLTSTLLLSSAPLFSPLLCFFLFSLFHLLLLLNLPPLLSLSLLLYHSPYRQILEEFFYSDLASVNDEEPPTFHTLIFNLQTRVDIYMYLLKYLI